jgi:hypothetical protein
MHTATGYTPHMLLFGGSPRDLRAPLAAPDNSGNRDIDVWLRSRKGAFEKANVSLVAARAAMIRAQKATGKHHTYKSGDLVKVSTRVLPLRATSNQVVKLLPKWIASFTVLSVQDKVAIVRLKLPATYKQVHDKFNVVDVRPWRGVITQPFWHVRLPRGTLEGAFGNSATTGGLHFTYCTRLSVHHFFFGVIENFSPLLSPPHRKSKKRLKRAKKSALSL